LEFRPDLPDKLFPTQFTTKAMLLHSANQQVNAALPQPQKTALRAAAHILAILSTCLHWAEASRTNGSGFSLHHNFSWNIREKAHLAFSGLMENAVLEEEGGRAAWGRKEKCRAAKVRGGDQRKKEEQQNDADGRQSVR
jgi:hypothetical protein